MINFIMYRIMTFNNRTIISEDKHLKVTWIDKKLMKECFNNNGYVLDFNNQSFSDFTINSIGYDIQGIYNCSKGRSLCNFIDEYDDYLIVRLCLDLIDYYKNILNDSTCKTKEREQQIEQLYIRFKEYEAQLDQSNIVLSEYVLNKFDSEYIERQIKILIQSIDSSPADAIGKSKELLESCFKFILDEQGITYSNNATIQELRKAVFIELNIEAKENVYAQSNKEIKKILSSLTQIVDGINHLRNEKGVGHGKGKNFEELPSRYASLVVNATMTIVKFIWETYDYRNKLGV